MLLWAPGLWEKLRGHLALGLETNCGAAWWQRPLSPLRLCSVEGSVSAQAVSLPGQFPGRTGREDTR